MTDESEAQLTLALREQNIPKFSGTALPPNSIVRGDSRTLLSSIPDETVRLVVTSPPYWDLVDYGEPDQIGQTGYDQYLDDLLCVFQQCERALMPNGKLCINTPIVPVPKQRSPKSQHTRELRNINNDLEARLLASTSLSRYSLYIWQKQTTVKMFGSYPYPPNIYENNSIEFINVLVKAGEPPKMDPRVRAANQLSQDEWIDLTRQIWWMYPENVARIEGHPAPFPELLPARLIKMYTFSSLAEANYPGDVILDPFGGIGTTAVAAKALGRRYISIDISEIFTRQAQHNVSMRFSKTNYDIRLRRLSDADLNQPISTSLE